MSQATQAHCRHPLTSLFVSTLLIRATLAAVALAAVGSTASAAMPALDANGWHSWQVEASAAAPDWCCFSWQDGVQTQSCDLDAGEGYGTSDRGTTHPDHVRIYTQVEDGQITSVRALGSTCPVKAAGSIKNHGSIPASDSVVWLARLVQPGSRRSMDALAAIAVHDSDEASRVLRQQAHDGADLELRKNALFWMGQVRAEEMRGDILDLMFNDPSPALREHAAFAWSQTNLPGVGDALHRLALNDPNAQVRGKGWFWMAQSGDVATEAAVLAALSKEKNPEVRQQAIFALSQLPHERGVDALIRALEDKSLPHSDRKMALFWMGQSESERAFDYLAGILK